MACLGATAMVTYELRSSVLAIGHDVYLVIATATPNRVPPCGIIAKGFECRSVADVHDFRAILTEQIRRVVEAIGGEICEA
jgi:hypothetical protein